jgi:hypothetical protein
MNDLNSSQPIESMQFDIFRDFELRETIEKTKSPTSSSNSNSNSNTNSNEPEQLRQLETNETNDLDNMIRTLPYMNDNIRNNIKLGIEIYKQLINFDRNYIHSIINANSTESNE